MPGPTASDGTAAFLLPVDGDPGLPQQTAYPLSALLENLGTLQIGTSGTYGSFVADPEAATPPGG